MDLFETKKHSIGKTIAELRKEKGWTQAELAQKLQVSDKAVSKWEKDIGIPSVEFFPMLAALFGVSIDYIMTGKSSESEIIFMSKAKFCAKNDDVSMLDAIDIRVKDEDGKTLIDYIVEFQSIKVFVAIAQTKGLSAFGLVNGLKLAITSNRLDLIDKSFWQRNKLYTNGNRDAYKDKNGILFLMPTTMAQWFRRGPAYDPDPALAECVLDDDFFSFLVCDDRINKDTLDFLLGKQERRKCVWYHAFPYLIHQAYINDKEDKLELLLDLAQKNNAYAYSTIDCKPNYPGDPYAMQCFCLPAKSTKETAFGLVRILDETITASLKKGDIKNAKRFNELNIDIKAHYSSIMPWNYRWNHLYIASEHELKLCDLKSKRTPEDKMREADCVYNGIIDVKQVLATSDYDFIEKMFRKYDFSHFETLERLYFAKKYKELYKLCIDLGLENLARNIIHYSQTESLDEMSREMGKIITSDILDNRNEEFLPYRSVQWGGSGIARKIIKMTKPFGQWYKSTEEKKAEILFGLKKKESIEADKESFLSLLNNTEELVIVIKLCVKLEEILAKKHQLTGDLLEMLTEWERTHNAQNAALLHKLRRRRNTLAHNVDAEDGQEELTADELKKCIEIICNMAQEN